MCIFSYLVDQKTQKILLKRLDEMMMLIDKFYLSLKNQKTLIAPKVCNFNKLQSTEFSYKEIDSACHLVEKNPAYFRPLNLNVSTTFFYKKLKL